jgi:hypothetical protein
MFENAPDELKRKLPHDIRLYMRNAWQHPNDPTRDYDFYGDDRENFLHYLADDDGPLVPGNWGDIVLLNFARGCLKTTTAVAIADWAVSQFPIIEFDITAPREDQFSEVMDRFKNAIKTSGVVNMRTKNNVSHQKFERQLQRDSGDPVHVEADVKARTAYGGGDALRGLHGHGGVIDEFQDVDESMFSTFLEAVDQSVPQVPYFPTIFIIGTPKMANSFFHELWKMSDQKTWDGDENEWVVEDESDEFLPHELKEQRRELQSDIENLKTYSADTPEEAERIETEIKQKREVLDTIQGYTVTGWHIDQYASPLHDNAKIEFKRQKYTEKKFKNEVLAEFYTPENDLLSDDHVTDAFDYDEGFTNKKVYDDSETVIGVDWGGGDSQQASDTVIVVAERIQLEDEHRLVVRDLKFLDPDLTKQQELEKVEQRIRDFEADRVAVDEGYGAKQREDLQDGNSLWNDDGYDQVCGIIYGNIKDKDKPKFAETGYMDSAYCTVARTHMIENMVDDFKAGLIDIPASDLTDGREGTQQRLLDQLTAPYTDRTETSGGKKKLKVMADRNDDAFQAFVYAWIAAERFGTTRTLKRIGTHNRAGL